MRQRKLYHLLTLFRPEDRLRFSEFLQTSYFNKSPTLVAFWEQWQRKLPGQTENGAMSAAEFVQGSKLKASRVDRLCSDLFAKAKQFLSLEAYGEQAVLQDLMFSSAILARDEGLETASRFVTGLVEELENSPDSPEKFLALLYHKAHLLIARVRMRVTEKAWQQDFGELQRLLQSFSTSKSLQMSCGAVNVGQVFKQDGDLPEQRVYAQMEAAETEDLGLLSRLYYLTLSLQLGKDAGTTFASLLALLHQHRAEIAEPVRFDVYSYVLNYCLRQINRGNLEFMQHTHELYLMLLQNGDLFVAGKLPPVQFKNMVALGCRLGHLVWVEGFLSEYLPRLSDAHDGLAKVFNEAVLYFHQGRYAEAIPRFRDLINEGVHDVFYGLDARIYLWKSFFEHLEALSSEEVDEMYRLYDSFRLYIDRNTKISPLHRRQYRNFVRLFKRFVLLLEEEGALQGLEEFRVELEAMEDIANKAWFSQKVAEALERRQGV